MILSEAAKIAVVLPEQPSKTERFAAQELVRYLEKIFGTGLCVSNGSEGEVTFLIGSPARNSAAARLLASAEFEKEVPGPEGYMIRIQGNQVLLAGSDNNGTLYAVYEFLESGLGCCFGAFSDPAVRAGEFVPHCDCLELPDMVKKKAAADLCYRTAIVQFNAWAGNADRKLALPFIDWLAKNRYNRILTWISIYEQFQELDLIGEIEKRGIRLTVGHHQSLTTFLPPEGNAVFPVKYAQEYPEFFRLNEDGTRVCTLQPGDYSGQWILCSRNEACIEEISRNILNWLDKNPAVDTVALWPNDGRAEQCRCGKCAPYSKTENYLYFENAVAQRLYAARPEIKVDVLIYKDLWECPEECTLCDSIVIDQATWTASGLRHCGKPDGSGFIGTDMDKNLRAYRKAGGRTVLYDYYMGNYGNRQAVMPAADEIQSLCRHLLREGHDGSGTQIECFNLWNNLLNFYCFARTAYDTSLSLEAGISGLCRLFGRGGAEIGQILRLYEATLDGQVPINKTGAWFAENVPAEEIYGRFETALRMAETALFRNNVRLMRMAFRYTMLMESDSRTAGGAFDDPTGELAVMAAFFDSFHANDPGFGIAIPVDNRTDRLPCDKWYVFE